MKKIILSIIVIGLLISTSMVSVNVFGLTHTQEQTELSGYAIPMADIYVDDNNTEGPWDGSYGHPYQFIQDGVDSASVGDIVFVFNGIYEEDVEIDKPLILVGENKDNTVIKGYRYVIDINADSVTVRGFKITKHPNSDSSYFTGIEVGSLSNIHQNNVIQNNMIVNGAGDHTRGIEIWGHSNNNIITGNIIKNMKATYDGHGYGIRVSSSWNNIITDNTIENTSSGYIGCGIYIGEWSHNNTVSRNTLKNNELVGIWLQNPDAPVCCDNNVSENIIKDSEYGILLDTAEPVSGNNMLYGNDISNNDVGVYLFYNVNYNTVLSNNIHGNNIGVYLEGVNYNTISSNTISKNNYGIKVINIVWLGFAYYSRYNTITENNITDNNLYGAFVGRQVDSNNFYYNNFEKNGGILIGGNAKDKGSNMWDDGNEMGNYWDDYLGWDLNPRDGIGDIPYIIPPLLAGNKDNYPIMGPYGSSQNNQMQIQSFPSSSPTNN